MRIQSPFFFYRGARMYLNQALEISPSDWEAMLGCVAVFEGKLAEGRTHLKKAEELKGSPFAPPDERHLRFLKETFLRPEEASSR